VSNIKYTYLVNQNSNIGSSRCENLVYFTRVNPIRTTN